MNEFKLCEEMGLEVLKNGLWTQPIIKASDVEKMLQGAERRKDVAYYVREVGSSGLGTPVYSKDESLVLTIPQKPKPISNPKDPHAP